MNAPIEDDRAGFLRAIRANPAADLPRLAFADWLDEQGNQDDSDRAEFIRVQCDIANAPVNGKMPFTGQPVRVVDGRLLEREFTLFDRYGKEWFGERWAILFLPHEQMGWQPNVREAVIRRGFVAEVTDTLDGHLGGECGTCLGGLSTMIRLEPVPERPDAIGRMIACHKCHGTGRTPGRLRDLRTRHPIESVRVTDREPEGWDHDWMNEVAWLDERSPIAASHGHCSLPAAVFDLLEGGRINDTSGTASNRNVWRIYQTATTADDALSRALLSLTNPEPTPCPS